MPAVSFLKAAEYQDAHPGYSDPLDERAFLVNTINQIEKSSFWKNTAIVIAYDDSDGWYSSSPRTTGSAASGSEVALTTPSRTASAGCSSSSRRTSIRSSSIRRPARSPGTRPG
jgi:phospholipase C